MKSLPACAAIALTLLVSACQDTATITGLDPEDAEPSLSVAAAVDGPALPFGPETFQRKRRRPRAETREFSIAGFQGPFTLYLQNGDDRGRRKVTRARVVLNDVEIFGRDDFPDAKSGKSVKSGGSDKGRSSKRGRSGRSGRSGKSDKSQSDKSGRNPSIDLRVVDVDLRDPSVL